MVRHRLEELRVQCRLREVVDRRMAQLVHHAHLVALRHDLAVEGNADLRRHQVPVDEVVGIGRPARRFFRLLTWFHRITSLVWRVPGGRCADVRSVATATRPAQRGAGATSSRATAWATSLPASPATRAGDGATPASRASDERIDLRVSTSRASCLQARRRLSARRCCAFRFWRNSDDAPVAVEVVADALADHERVGIEQQRAPAIEADRGLQDLDRFAAQSVDIRARVRQVVDALTTALTLPLTRHAITVPRERGRATSQPCGVAGAKIPAFWDRPPHSAPAGSW